VRGNTDDLVEEYSGVGFRFQNRNAGSERIGVGIELSRYSQTWREQTVAAVALEPELLLYSRRVMVRPTASVALTRQVHVRGGLMATELTPLDADRSSTRINAAVFGAGLYYRPEGSRHGFRKLDADVEFHQATEALASDLIYRRALGRARFELESDDSRFIADFRAGRITGSAPLFERFALGDTETLRGWNKYDLAPAGSDRMWHQSVEFRYESFAYFVDAGSLWNGGDDRRIRVSTGVGFHHDNAFVTLAFPLNADKVNATMLFGVRF
jgi:outer membrane translocation and assembly module TamA